MIVAELTVIPIGTADTGLSHYISKAVDAIKATGVNVDAIKATGVKHQVHPAGTVFEAPDLDTAFQVARRAHGAVLDAGAKRVITKLTIDERIDKSVGLEERVRRVTVKT